ncbi:DNA polymerase catalytic subunit [Trichinella spiralis]|uniref:DNA polymerase catalytic subunit n=1 Tax=Trichinella spiralis TaxID=6334 RepID=A0ABR3KMJ3_TRISP
MEKQFARKRSSGGASGKGESTCCNVRVQNTDNCCQTTFSVIKQDRGGTGSDLIVELKQAYACLAVSEACLYYQDQDTLTDIGQVEEFLNFW